jgi:16S rRNA processing protein RimM
MAKLCFGGSTLPVLRVAQLSRQFSCPQSRSSGSLGGVTPRMGSARRPRAPRARSRTDSPEAMRDDPWTTDKLGFVLVGTIIGAHGVRGEAKVRADTDFGRQRLGTVSTAAQRYLLLPGRRYPRPIGVLAGTKATQDDVWIVRLEGVDTRDAVEERRGARIYVKEADRPRMSRDEFLVGDLVGMRVALAEYPEDIIGCIRSVVTRQELCAASGAGAAAAAVANDLLEVALGGAVDVGGGESTLVPFVKQIVPSVSRRDRLVLLTPPEGLLEIAMVNDKYKAPPPRGLLCAATEF